MLLFNSRNIRRKSISDTILAWKLFLDELPKEKREKCTLVLHTEPVSEHGTDLGAVIEYFFPNGDGNVVISADKLSTEQMNMLYNCADSVILISSAEGWGLALTESLLTGTPFIANVTGGMQDQMRFEDENGDWINLDKNVPSKIIEVPIQNMGNGYYQHSQLIYQLLDPQLHLTFMMIDVLLKMLLRKLWKCIRWEMKKEEKEVKQVWNGLYQMKQDLHQKKCLIEL